MRFENRAVEKARRTDKMSGLDGKEKLYNSRGLLERSSYDTHILPSLRDDPKLDISNDDATIVREYLDRQSPAYRAELHELVKEAPPLSPTTKLSIAIPAYKEGVHIFKTLEHYAKLEDPSKFEVVILENHTTDVPRDTTASEIARFKEQYPDIQITHLYKTFDQKRIGGVRKYLTDSILERKQEAGRHDSIVIASNDADLEDINPKYVKLLIKAFENDPKLDAVRGGIDHPADSFVQFPLMHASIRFLSYFRMTLRRYMPDTLPLVGRNSAMRSGIYAASGGYNEKAVVAEDIEIGRLIGHGRKNRPGHVRYLHNAWIETNPRREIESILAGTPIIRRYDGFVSNEHMYDIPVEKLIEQGQDFSTEQFKTELQAAYDHYKSHTNSEGGPLTDEAFAISYDRAMRFLGIKYHLQGDSVIIDDLSKLTNELTRYGERNARAA